MKENKNVWFYILGLIIGLIVIPLTESIMDVCYQWVEVMKIKPTSMINEWNKEMTSDTESEMTCAIGFQAPNKSDDDYFGE